MNALQKLENWNSKHKARCCSIEIDDGYGATCWRVQLWGEKGHVYACETGYFAEERTEKIEVESEENDYIGYIVSTLANERTLYVSSKKDPKDWPGLERVILAAIDFYENVL